MTSGILTHLVLTGITNGAVYALVALGFVTIFRASNILNLAQGEFVTLGGLGTVFFLKKGIAYFPAAFMAVALTVLAGMGMERIAIRPLRKKSMLSLIMVTIGISFLLQGMAAILFGPDPRSLPPFIGRSPVVLWGVVRINPQSMFVMGLAVALAFALEAFSRFTLAGKAMEAVSTDRRGAALVGINRNRITMIAFGISAGVGALAGIFITPIYFTQYNAGTLLGLKGFAAAVIGGWGKYPGALLGGMVLGVLESVSIGCIPSGYKDGVAFAALILILYLRPRGILGSRALMEARK